MMMVLNYISLKIAIIHCTQKENFREQHDTRRIYSLGYIFSWNICKEVSTKLSLKRKFPELTQTSLPNNSSSEEQSKQRLFAHQK